MRVQRFFVMVTAVTLLSACSGGGPTAPGAGTTGAGGQQGGGGGQGGGQGQQGGTAPNAANLNVDIGPCGPSPTGTWEPVGVSVQSLGFQWRLINGLIPTPGNDPCPPPTRLECDPDTITLIRANDNTMSFQAIFQDVSIQNIDQWTIVFEGGSDQDVRRTANLNRPAGIGAPSTTASQLTFSAVAASAGGNPVDGCMIMTRSDNNRTSYYRVQQGSPGTF